MSSIPPIFADGFGDVAPGSGEVCVGCGARVEHDVVLCAACRCEGRTVDEPPATDGERAWLAAITGRLDIRTGDVWTLEPAADVVAELATRGLAFERPDPRRAAWVVVAREEPREPAAPLFGVEGGSQLERVAREYAEELPRTRSRSRAMRRAAARVRRGGR